MLNCKTENAEFYLRGIVHYIEQKQNHELEAYGVTSQQGRALLSIYRFQAKGNTPTQKNLQATLGISGPSVTSLLKTLERKELITRTSGEEDNRVKYIELTQRGQTLIDGMKAAFREVTDTLNKSITKDEKKLLENVLKKVYECFSADNSS